jgi:hypothetical protein
MVHKGVLEQPAEERSFPVFLPDKPAPVSWEDQSPTNSNAILQIPTFFSSNLLIAIYGISGAIFEGIVEQNWSGEERRKYR